MEESRNDISAIARMSEIVNPKFASCRLDNYLVGNDAFSDKRKHALDAVTEYAKGFRKEPRSGKNLILIGTCGTGKDHLAVGVIRSALAQCGSIKYVRGAVLSSICREHCLKHSSDVPTIYKDADLLVLSDIEPNPFKVTEFEYRYLLTLIDHRYCHKLPTIITTNSRSLKDLAMVIGEMVVDRLCDNAVIVPMIWESYRKRGEA